MKTNRGYYDVHCHILPGVDDGAANIEVARDMLKCAYDQGIRTIIATPHYSIRTSLKEVVVQEKFNQLQLEAQKIDPEYQIFLGSEVYYEPGILEKIKQEKRIALAGSRYVLVEFPVNETYREIYEGMHNLLVEGYAPVLAHVERYLCLKEIDKVAGLIDAGVYIQMNASSCVGSFLDKEANYCRKLLKAGYVHLLGTDAHNMGSRRPEIETAIVRLRKIISQNQMEQVLYMNPAKILQNEYI